MSEMVERVARAIFDADNDLDGDCVGDMIYGDFRIDGPAAHAKEETMRVCRAAARAAIGAMREPTEAMVKVGVDYALSSGISNENRWPDYIANKHRLMISQALNEEG